MIKDNCFKYRKADYTIMNTISMEFSEQLNYFLSKAIQYDKADMGNIQLFSVRTETLEIVAQQVDLKVISLNILKQ
jgi:hypothetical protein